jgi:hypothetical protein
VDDSSIVTIGDVQMATIGTEKNVIRIVEFIESAPIGIWLAILEGAGERQQARGWISCVK